MQSPGTPNHQSRNFLDAQRTTGITVIGERRGGAIGYGACMRSALTCVLFLALVTSCKKKEESAASAPSPKPAPSAPAPTAKAPRGPAGR
ncbi:MAG TPA: hypothetical protein VGM90_41490 [Kofleriaceae bacterium]